MKRKKRQKKLTKRLTFLLLSLLLFFAVLYQYEKQEQRSHFIPNYKPLNLSPLLEELDYKTIFYQTGLSKTAIQAQLDITTSNGSLFTSYQEHFFAPVKISCEKNTLFSAEEKIDTPFHLVPLEDGDILITLASHTFTYRNGHCAIVVDGAKNQTLESVVLGQNSILQSLDKWTRYPNVVVLRLKRASIQLRKEIAANAKKMLVDIPYRLTVGLFTKKEPPQPGTNCAHLVWQAFKRYGYDLDSDGGMIVTPFDLLQSNQLEIIQIYGVNPYDYVDRIGFY